MPAGLTDRQKSYLAQLARRACNQAGALARGRGEEWTAPDPDAWRRSEVARACGKLGLRCCSQPDYKLIEAHFLNLLGESGAAMNALLAAAGEERREAEAVLWREMTKAQALGITRDYVNAICVRQFGCSVLEADPKQLWALVYTVRNRAAAKRKKLNQDPL